MTTFSKSLLPMSADRLKKRTKVPVAIRVRHHNKVGYISTGRHHRGSEVRQQEREGEDLSPSAFFLCNINNPQTPQ